MDSIQVLCFYRDTEAAGGRVSRLRSPRQRKIDLDPPFDQVSKSNESLTTHNPDLSSEVFRGQNAYSANGPWFGNSQSSKTT